MQINNGGLIYPKKQKCIFYMSQSKGDEERLSFQEVSEIVNNRSDTDDELLAKKKIFRVRTQKSPQQSTLRCWRVCALPLHVRDDIQRDVGLLRGVRKCLGFEKRGSRVMIFVCEPQVYWFLRGFNIVLVSVWGLAK